MPYLEFVAHIVSEITSLSRNSNPGSPVPGWNCYTKVTQFYMLAHQQYLLTYQKYPFQIHCSQLVPFRRNSNSDHPVPGCGHYTKVKQFFTLAHHEYLFKIWCSYLVPFQSSHAESVREKDRHPLLTLEFPLNYFSVLNVSSVSTERLFGALWDAVD